MTAPIRDIERYAFRGIEYPDGVVGFDYEAQAWIDTRPTAERDTQYPAGSASNPLPDLLA